MKRPSSNLALTKFTAEPSNHPLTDHNDPRHGSGENVIGKHQQWRSRRQLSPSDMSRIPSSLCVWRSKEGQAERVTYGLGNAYPVWQAQSSNVCQIEPSPRSCKAPTSFTANSTSTARTWSRTNLKLDLRIIHHSVRP